MQTLKGDFGCIEVHRGCMISKVLFCQGFRNQVKIGVLSSSFQYYELWYNGICGTIDTDIE